MIKNPVALILFLLAIEAGVLYLAAKPSFQQRFRFLPPVFWIYFLPMLASTSGLIDSKNPVYQVIITHFLPASLILLLVSVNIRSIFKLGKSALIMFFAGSAGIILGAPLVFFIFRSLGLLGAESWSGFGALSASWTGGSANMIAVKEALGTPDHVFLPMVIVDTIVPYVWMGLLVAMAGAQPMFDRWNLSDRRVMDQLSRRAVKTPAQLQNIPLSSNILWILFLAVCGSIIAQFIGLLLPEVPGVISTYAWTILTVTLMGIFFSFTPVRKLEEAGSTKIGYFILYFVLTAIGAKASLAHIGSTLVLIAAGIFIVFIHVCVLLAVGRLIKAPMFLAAVASQANIGGVASAPIVAEIYQPGMASVGLLLAILGNIVGTYFGIVAGQLCRLLGG